MSGKLETKFSSCWVIHLSYKISMKWFILDLSANEIDIFALKNNPGSVRLHDWKLMGRCEKMFGGYRVPKTA